MNISEVSTKPCLKEILEQDGNMGMVIVGAQSTVSVRADTGGEREPLWWSNQMSPLNIEY